MKFFWYIFADGYKVRVSGFTTHELALTIFKHGNLVKTIPA